MSVDESRVCYVCKKSDGLLGPQQEQEFGYVHDACWPVYKDLPEVTELWADEQRRKDERKLWEQEGRQLGGQRQLHRSKRDTLRRQEEQLQFRVGDWLLRGEESGFVNATFVGGGKGFRVDYRKAAQLTGYSKSSLHTFASVARQVPACIRMQVPWAVHQSVARLAKLGVEVQKELLTKAETEGLSVAKVNALVRERLEDVPPQTSRTPEKVLYGPSDARATRAMAALDKALPDDPTQVAIMKSFMSPSVRNNLVKKLEETADQLRAFATAVRNLPVSHEPPDSVYKAVKDQRKKAMAEIKSASAKAAGTT